jgi:outer membrane receptor protein involved in Fe transport
LVAQSERTFSPQAIAALGLDLRDIRGTDNETGETGASAGVTTSTSAHQRAIGGFADALWQPRNWLISASIRADSFRTFSARQVVSSTGIVTQLPELDELFAGPHLGVVRNLGANAALTANAFRAFRGPTLNELYRNSQVGSQTTLANNTLLAERATGFELGGNVTLARLVTVRGSYFWTEVNRPISTIQISQTPPPPATPVTQTLQRENLGQIRSRGLSLDAELRSWRHFDASIQYQLACATVTSFVPATVQQPSLVGNWIPEVPREAITATANYMAPRFANLHAIASYTGESFDDTANQAILHPYARLDVSADRALGHGLSLFVGAQNLLNRSIDAGRTPILTLAPPRLVQGGLRYAFRR